MPRIRVNSANSSELQLLPGVGPVRAAKAVAYRESNGRFQNLPEFGAAVGMGGVQLLYVRPFVSFADAEAIAPAKTVRWMWWVIYLFAILMTLNLQLGFFQFRLYNFDPAAVVLRGEFVYFLISVSYDVFLFFWLFSWCSLCVAVPRLLVARADAIFERAVKLASFSVLLGSVSLLGIFLSKLAGVVFSTDEPRRWFGIWDSVDVFANQYWDSKIVTAVQWHTFFVVPVLILISFVWSEVLEKRWWRYFFHTWCCVGVLFWTLYGNLEFCVYTFFDLIYSIEDIHYGLENCLLWYIQGDSARYILVGFFATLLNVLMYSGTLAAYLAVLASGLWGAVEIYGGRLFFTDVFLSLRFVQREIRRSEGVEEKLSKHAEIFGLPVKSDVIRNQIPSSQSRRSLANRAKAFVTLIAMSIIGNACYEIGKSILGY